MLPPEKACADALEQLRDHHGSQIASVVHLAAYYDFSGEPSPKYKEVTVEGTRRLLQALRKMDFEVGQFIFSSTMLVHKPTKPGRRITEDSPIEPAWPYPESKVRTEEVIRGEGSGIPAVILRIAGVYDDMCHSIPLAHQIQRIYERRMTSHVYSGETSHGQSFVHLDDVAGAIERVVRRRAELSAGIPILLGEPETVSYKEIQDRLGRLLHGEGGWETVQVPEPLAKAGAWIQEHLPGEDPFIKPWMTSRAGDHYALDISRARELLEWEPKHTLRESLPVMVEVLQRDPRTWYEENNLTPTSEVDQ